jgi:hypothetical protein
MRMAVYDSLRDVVDEIIRGGNVTNGHVRKFDGARGEVPFLFGKEVNSYLDGLREAMIKHHALDGREDDSSLDARDRHFAEIGRFYNEFGAHLLPYMRMHQKAPYF